MRLFFVLLCGASLPTWSQTWAWPGCSDVTDANFAYTDLVRRGVAPDASLAEPIKMDFDRDAQGNVDIYFVELRGNVKRYNAVTKTVTTLATLPRWTGPYTSSGVTNLNEGITGIVLDPQFKTNHFLYIHWSPANAIVFRISRFTVSDNILTAEKILLDIPAQRNACCHTGGGMAFDAYGDLWIGMGNNTDLSGGENQSINEVDKYKSDEWGASSTAGLRGSILRVHPDNSTRGYAIPPGNFGEYFAQQTGNAQYNDTNKVKPEIYAKGTRNPYTLQLDPVRRWVMWGDIGPDRSLVHEEYNLSHHPGFYGWPYFAGNNLSFVGSKDPTAPTNTSKWNTGLGVLPPAITAIFPYAESAAITGPIYRYDGDLTSTVKLPPHFTRKWFVTDWNNNQIRLFTLDSAGLTVIQNQRIFANHSFSGILDLKTGPDGALYTINYGNAYYTSGPSTSITKITYTGNCRPTDPKLEKAVGTYLNPNSRYVTQPKGWVVNLQSHRPVMVPIGMTGFQLFDLLGEKVWEIRKLHAGEEFVFPSDLPSGAMKYRWLPSGR